jgi:hypothetical protein
MAFVNFAAYSSNTASCTMKRFAAMHDCPLLTMRAFTPMSTALSRSADGMTTNGSLPPSSRTDFLMCLAAMPATEEPAGSLPVSVAARTRSLSSTRVTWPDVMSSVWNSPSVNPASWKISSMASAHCGTFDECFSRPQFPAISAGAAKRKTCQNGKFHGITASTGPMGW